MKEARALIVDDDPALLQALSEALQLRMEGLLVETCESAADALQRIALSDFDAIVADIKMPGVDGLELMRRLRDLRPELPVLLITGHGEHDLAVQALRSGAYDYVQKPIDRNYFVRSLTQAIEKHRLSRKVARQKHALEQHTRKLENWLEHRTHEFRELYEREALIRAELEKTSKDLQAARHRRDELISMIAHDLGSPLTTLRGYAELLARPNASPALRERAKAVILSETGRMARLVEDLVRDPESAPTRFSIQARNCNLVELARAQVEVAAARSQHHAIVMDAPKRLSLRCDPERVAQVLANLLNNAIAYASEGEIKVRLWREAGEAHLCVRDHGPGIPIDELSNIFEPHVRLNGRTTGPYPGGAGLGLSIARDIIESHGGRIWADNNADQGSTFRVVLPISDAHRSHTADASSG
jgi:two-component system, sensor histidine kinase and response regulator